MIQFNSSFFHKDPGEGKNSENLYIETNNKIINEATEFKKFLSPTSFEMGNNVFWHKHTILPKE